MNLSEVLQEVVSQKKCLECPLVGKTKPLVIEPHTKDRIKAVIVTEAPWRDVDDIEYSTSHNYHTSIFPYLYSFLSGNFKPRENANTYWTHTCKCYLKGASRTEKSKAKGLQ